MNHIALPIFLAALCGATTLAQAPGAHWSVTTVTGSMPPLTRENPGVSDGSGMLVFGGIDMVTGLRSNGLWRFDGASWTQLSADGATGSPPARAQCAVAWDFARGRLVVFGGSDGRSSSTTPGSGPAPSGST